MILNIWTNIGDKIGEILEPIKNFFVNNCRNPFLWIGIIVVALIIFEFVYKSLRKD